MLQALTALALASSAFAKGKSKPDEPNKLNSIVCLGAAFGNAETYSKDAFVSLGLGIGAHICDGSGKVTLQGYAQDVALAVAQATVATYAECKTEGDEVYGHVEAYAKVTASAEAHAVAIGKGWASVETCTGCKAQGDFFVKATKDLFVKAIAESKTDLEVYGEASGKPKVEFAGEIVKKVAKQIEVAFVDILVEVERMVDRKGAESCTARVAGCAKVGENGACCDVTAGAAKLEISTTAVAKAAVSVKALGYGCHGKPKDKSAEDAAFAVAKAYAAAVAAIDGYCEATDGATACYWGSAHIKAFASAQAAAFAKAWVEANNDCNCEINLDLLVKAVEKVFVDAHAAVFADVCVSGARLDFLVFEKDFEVAVVKAFAKVVANAWTDGKECGVSAEACAVAGSSKACCEVSANGYPDDLSEDANAEAIALAGGFVCPGKDGAGDLDAEAKVVAKAIAKAIAVAAIDFSEWCESEGYAGFCSRLDGWLTAHASAQARSFAEAFAATPFGCDCTVEASAMAEAIEVIYSRATVDIHRKVCGKDGEGVDNADTLIKIVEKEIEAIATAIAKVRSNGKNCEASASAEVPGEKDMDADEVCGHCVDSHQECAADEDTGDTVLGCCQKDDICVRRSKKVAVCKKKGSKAVERYEKRGYGQVLTCPKLNKH